MSDLESKTSEKVEAEVDINEDVDEDMDEFNDNEEGPVVFQNSAASETEEGGDDASGDKKRIDNGLGKLFEMPEFTRKDKTLEEILDLMTDNPPIIPDAVTDYYLRKNGFECTDVRVKRLLALATQKFINDIANDAYEYSRIRSTVAVSNANNAQARARQLMASQQQPGQQQITQQQQQQNEKTTASKVVLTVNDLSSAVQEYGLNIGRPDFYH